MTEFPVPGPSEPLNLSPTAEDYAEARAHGDSYDSYDDGLAEPANTAPKTGKEAVLQRLKQQPTRGFTDLWSVRTRPGISVRFSLGVDPDVVRRAAAGAAPEKARRRQSGPLPSEIDETNWLAVVLGHYNSEIRIDGQVWRDDLGEPVTFRSDDFREVYQEKRIRDNVLRFYGDVEGEGVLVSHGRALLRESGVASENPVEAEEDTAAGPTVAT